MSYLVEQPLEILLLQALYLDYESILNTIKANPELEDAFGERFWRDKTRRDFPRLTVTEGESYRETYRILSSGMPMNALEADRDDLIRYYLHLLEVSPLEFNGEMGGSSIISRAIKHRAVKVLRLLIRISGGGKIHLNYAISRGDVELATIFVEEGVTDYRLKDLFSAVALGRSEMLDLLLPPDRYPPTFFEQLYYFYRRQNRSRASRIRKAVEGLLASGRRVESIDSIKETFSIE